MLEDTMFSFDDFEDEDFRRLVALKLQTMSKSIQNLYAQSMNLQPQHQDEEEVKKPIMHNDMSKEVDNVKAQLQRYKVRIKQLEKNLKKNNAIVEELQIQNKALNEEINAQKEASLYKFKSGLIPINTNFVSIIGVAYV